MKQSIRLSLAEPFAIGRELTAGSRLRVIARQLGRRSDAN